MTKNYTVNALGVPLYMLALFYSSVTISDQNLQYNANSNVIGDWLEEWSIANTRASSGNYILYHFTDRMYVVTSPLEWKPDDPNSSIDPIEVPKGFVTDFTSVPRIFWAAFPPDGAYGFPAVFHDYLYWTQAVTRKEADRIFKIMMDEFDVGKVSSTTIHVAVRAGGEFAWQKNKKDCLKGERRLLEQFPENQPNTKWKDWKLNSKVFGAPICSAQ